MLKNEYRRALIMLRPLEVSWSGHIRLERRTLMGTMQFTVFGPRTGDRLLALMVGVRHGRMQAHPLGELRNGGRGQAGLRCEFDPRDMGGLTLEQYDLAAIAQWNGERWTLVMSGFPNGSKAMDWRAAQDAVAAQLTPPARAETSVSSILPEEISVSQTPPAPEDAAQEQLLENPAYPEWSNPDGTDTPAGAASEESGAFSPAQPAPVAPVRKTTDSSPESPEPENWPEEFDVPAETESQPLLENPVHPEWSNPDGMDTPAGAVSEEEDAFHVPNVPKVMDPDEDEPPGIPDPFDIPAFGMDDFDIPAREPDASDSPEAPASLNETALSCLSLEAGEWPETIAPLQTLFASSPPWPQSPEEGFVFVHTPMPQGCGYEYTLTGLRAENGQLADVMYAVPAPASAEPPPGLEDYTWQDGYWRYRHPVGCS